MAYQSAIFDVDGVLVDSPRELAWREPRTSAVTRSQAPSGCGSREHDQSDSVTGHTDTG